MADKLRALVEKRDRANARPHRLTGEPVLPEHGAASKRRVCLVCRRVDDADMREAHREKYPHIKGTRALLKSLLPPMNCCPHDDGELVEISG